ncbi:sensor histidine kinase [Actinoplanes xinjiangensis]|uniref:sensor histidine kinase n=1 Tax=Actinoplanes xinjiangensis TaxID=512350 RepID=UPI00341C089F
MIDPNERCAVRIADPATCTLQPLMCSETFFAEWELMPHIRAAVLESDARLKAVARARRALPSRPLSLDTVAWMAAQLLDAPMAVVALVGADEDEFLGMFGLPEPFATVRRASTRQSLCAYVVSADDMVTVGDLFADADLCSHPAVTLWGVRGFAGAPLRDSAGRVVGAVAVFDTRSRAWPAAHLATLSKMTARLGPLSEVVGGGSDAAMAALGSTHAQVLAQAAADVDAPTDTVADAQVQRGFITALLDSLQVGVVAFGNDGRPVLFNRMLRHLYGLGGEVSAIEAMASVYGTLHQPDGALMAADELVVARALQGETVRDAEALLHAVGLPDRYLVINGQPILDAGGEQLGAVSTVLDVTERQRSERLRDCELQIARLLVTAAAIGYAATPLAEAVGEALGWPYVSLMLVDPVAGVLRPVAQWNAPGLPVLDLLPQHVPRGRAEGGVAGQVWATSEPVWIPELTTSPYAAAPAVRAFIDAAAERGLHTSAAVPIRDGDHVVGVLTALSDSVEHDRFLIIGMLTGIAEQIGHFLARQRSVALQAQLVRAKDDFLTLAGHEMRTPLMSITSYSSLLADEPGLSDDIRHMLSVINRNTDVLRDIIDQLLELTGLETGHHTMHPQITDLSAVATAAAAAADPPPGIRLHTDVPATLALDADPHRLRQIIDELLANAIKYSPDRGDIHIRVHEPHEGVAELTVTDPGLGIPAHEREQLFGRFERGTARHSTLKGAGLGLTLVKVLVEAHGGIITIDPDHQPGTRIVVRLPTSAAAAVGATAVQDGPDPLPGRAPGPGYARPVAFDWSPSVEA